MQSRRTECQFWEAINYANVLTALAHDDKRLRLPGGRALGALLRGIVIRVSAVHNFVKVGVSPIILRLSSHSLSFTLTRSLLHLMRDLDRIPTKGLA